MPPRRLTGNLLLLLAFTAVAVYLTWQIIQPFVNVLIWAGVLAVVSYPVYVRWRRRGWGPSLASVFTVLFVILTIVVPLALVGAMLVKQIPTAIEATQGGVRQLLDPDSRVFQFVNRHVDLEQFRNPQWLAERAKTFTAAVAQKTLGLLGGVLGVVVQTFFVLFTLYYLLKDADRIAPAIRDALPLERSQAEQVFARTRDIVSASLNGVLVISAIQGLMGGLAFWALGLPSPVLWGVVMFLLSMIPLTGAAIVWLPAAIYLASIGAWGKAIALTAWGAGAIGMVDNVLRPRLVGERTRLHELIVFFSVLGGLQVFGVMGLVVGPVIVAVTISLVEVFKRVEWGGMMPTVVATGPRAEVAVDQQEIDTPAVIPPAQSTQISISTAASKSPSLPD
jgi:predicted PurR-regulated permease PerM